MALTRDFKETVQARVQRDPKFRESLITEAAGALLAGDVEDPLDHRANGVPDFGPGFAPGMAEDRRMFALAQKDKMKNNRVINKFC